MVTRKLSISPKCFIFFLTFQAIQVQNASSQEQPNYATTITDPTASQCLAQPCTYQNDCRSKLGICGEDLLYCNSASSWVPACGGGGTLPKPIVEISSNNNDDNGAGSGANVDSNLRGVPTSSPTTAWEAFVKENNLGGNGGNNDKDQGVKGLTTGKEGQGNSTYVPQNETGWFDSAGWSNTGRPEEDEGGILDKMKFWGGDGDENAAAKDSFGVGSWLGTAVSLVLMGVMGYV